MIVSGTAPENADSAVVVMRLNSESAVVGDASVLIHDVGYVERGTRVNLAPNPEFAQGLAGWGVYGEPLGSASITATEEGNGRSVLLQALADQVLNIDGVPFPITPGAEFEFRATLSVPEGSFEHGSVAVVFLENLEVARTTIPFLPEAVALGTIETDGAGAFARQLGDLDPGRYKFRAVYFGDDHYWMSWAFVVGNVTG